MASGGASGTGAPTKQKSKAYLSSVAIQSDAIKYRQKYKELKRKVHEIEQENDKLQAFSLRIKNNIHRLRIERAILYERLEADASKATIVEHEPNAHMDPVRDAADTSTKEQKSMAPMSSPSKEEHDSLVVELDDAI